jgi:hypothetical protein
MSNNDVFKQAKAAVVVPVTTAAPVSAGKPFDAIAFLNFKVSIKEKIEGEDVVINYSPKGAVFPRKWCEDPDNASKWEAIQKEGGLAKLKCNYKIIKGDALNRIELDKLSENLNDELKALLKTVQAQTDDSEYTRYLRVVGDLCIVSKAGKERKLQGVFQPNLDFKVGNEAKALESQIHLVNAVMNGKDISWSIESLEMYKPEDESTDEY